MRHSDEEFHSLGVLIDTGQIEQLGKRLLVLWPPNAKWDREDVLYLSPLLQGIKKIFGEKADPIYYAYAKRFKSHNDNLGWLRTLPNRSDVVKMYEGTDTAIAWLEALRPQITPPDDGVIDLLVGRILRAKGALAEARGHLLHAARQGLAGIVWYLLEALNEMAVCLAQLGETRLAFEYARTLSIEAFKLGRMKEHDLYRSVYNTAMIFGQVDYMVEVKRNLIHKAYAEGDFARVSQHESDASLRLAMIGVRDEAIAGMYRAAKYSVQGSRRSSPYFVVICHLLARYLDQTPLSDDELEVMWSEAARVIHTPSVSVVLSAMQKKVREHTPPDAVLLQRWLSLCERYQFTPDISVDETEPLLICNHLAALMGRYYTEQQNEALAARFIEVVALSESIAAIFSFARMDYANRLIRNGKAQQALKVCQLALARHLLPIDERFVFAQLAARSCLDLGRDQQAFAYAKRALSAWRRILDGLFVEEHKAAWLDHGASVISCLMKILVSPLPWISEEERYREIFEIIELGKARLMTDMVSHSGHVSGVYLFQELMKKPDDLLQVLSSEGPDWEVPYLLQSVVHADMLKRVYHNDSGWIEEVANEADISALQSMILLPLSPEKSLYTTAQSLPFEKQAEPPSSELYDDLVQMMAPRGEEG